jgi:hypothetical protein
MSVYDVKGEGYKTDHEVHPGICRHKIYLGAEKLLERAYSPPPGLPQIPENRIWGRRRLKNSVLL